MKLLLGIKGKGTEFVFRPSDLYENIASKRTPHQRQRTKYSE